MAPFNMPFENLRGFFRPYLREKRGLARYIFVRKFWVQNPIKTKFFHEFCDFREKIRIFALYISEGHNFTKNKTVYLRLKDVTLISLF